ncbi:hypothetical protein HYV72_00065 [Candidatus Uhrbacteria bacterium]|nr:hypothetical protein [Candidatus Uhrbacteria bacterium]
MQYIKLLENGHFYGETHHFLLTKSQKCDIKIRSKKKTNLNPHGGDDDMSDEIQVWTRTPGYRPSPPRRIRDGNRNAELIRANASEPLCNTRSTRQGSCGVIGFGHSLQKR